MLNIFFMLTSRVKSQELHQVFTRNSDVSFSPILTISVDYFQFLSEHRLVVRFVAGAFVLLFENRADEDTGLDRDVFYEDTIPHPLNSSKQYYLISKQCGCLA